MFVQLFFFHFSHKNMDAIRFRPGKTLEYNITARNQYEDANNLARRDLQRYYFLMQNTPVPLTEIEFQACVGALLSTLFETELSIKNLYFNIDDACEYENLHLNYDIDRDLFVKKIKALSLFERCVVVDAIERERVKILQKNLAYAKQIGGV